MLLSAAQEGAGQQDDAIRTLEATLEENPSSSAAHVRLAELYEQQRRLQEAADAYAHAQAANTRADLGARQRRRRSSMPGNPAQARDILQATIARRTTPDAGAPVHAGAVAAAAEGLRRRGGDHAQKLKTAFPDDSRGLVPRGADAPTIAGKKTEAIAAFERTDEASPERCIAGARVREPPRKGWPRCRTLNVRCATSAREGSARRERAQLARLPARRSRPEARRSGRSRAARAQGRARQSIVPRQPRVGILPAGQTGSGRPAADRGGAEGAGELGDPGSPRRPAVQAAAFCGCGLGMGAIARGRRRIHRSRRDREEDARRAVARRAGSRVAVARPRARSSCPRCVMLAAAVGLRPVRRHPGRCCRPAPALHSLDFTTAYAKPLRDCAGR